MCHVDKGDTHAVHLRSWFRSSLLSRLTSMASMYKAIGNQYVQYPTKSSRETRPVSRSHSEVAYFG
jgi:hypothetical protein